MEIIALGMLALMGGLYGAGIILAIARARRDVVRNGFLNAHDGQLFLPGPASEARHTVTISHEMPGMQSVTRLTVRHVHLAETLGFRMQGLTQPQNGRLEGRLVVDGTKDKARARRLFARPEVRDALAVLCGSAARFKQLDLYPGGDLIVDVLDGPVEDLKERLLRFAAALDDAAPHVAGDALPVLAAASGAASSAAFSIEIRS